ncbi:MAG: hypothetical protein ACRDRL_23520, partial [Sciscionella sp.]
MDMRPRWQRPVFVVLGAAVVLAVSSCELASGGPTPPGRAEGNTMRTAVIYTAVIRHLAGTADSSFGDHP